ncbi:MAG: metallophosphoesterase [Phycisphaerales bacterium]|nr:metallophosphoesterase [Phycisphaerales bacterium]
MRTAIISDVHSNLSALETVLSHIDGQRVDRIISLGDIVGYGPDPVECVDLVASRCEWSLMGNHDFGVLYEPTNFNAAAEQSAYWTRRQLDGETNRATAEKRWNFLGRLRVRVAFGSYLCVHGTPRRPINEYLFPEDVVNSVIKMRQIFERIDLYCLVGHTHVPGIFTDEPDFYCPSDFENVYTMRLGEKVIINPGSVGQPRDSDPRASYAILEAEVDGQADKVEFFRLDYDIERTVKRIHNTPELHDWLGDRLRQGR